MKLTFSLLVLLFLANPSFLFAQDVFKFDQMTVVQSERNNVVVEIELSDRGSAISSQVARTNANRKVGFNPILNSNNNSLSLEFTRNFNEQELSILLELAGIKLNIELFNQLLALVNQ